MTATSTFNFRILSSTGFAHDDTPIVIAEVAG